MSQPDIENKRDKSLLWDSLAAAKRIQIRVSDILEKSKQKDVEIKRLRGVLEGIRDAALDNMEGADADEFAYQESLFKTCSEALEK